MFSSSVQPSILSLFSSTSSDPLSLFTSSTDNDLPSDSFIHLLHDRLSTPLPENPRNLLHLPAIRDEGEGSDSLESRNLGTELEQTVLHIQSPTIRTTYIQSPAIGSSSSGSDSPSFELGIRHPWMHIQVRNLGRDWSFEVGISDQKRRIGVIRLSTFQVNKSQRVKEPNLKINHAKPGSGPLLLLLPLSFPANSSNPLTPWSTISVHFPSLLPYFSSPTFRPPPVEARAANGDDADPHILTGRPQAPSLALTPSGKFSHVSYVRVYANCRLRRLWFSEEGPSQKVPWEFELYASD
ncbi:hypothetical protein CVT26_004769 [Gymnopilus dilepis]|uniref:CFA20 domain-containing protein n=1 Tax=Gymnopilus dilepis TaxID=231916 RepID=A0A409XZC4_9AGAR|nr:hypothetical protein CVT26_004769 [Gymnopilus dilepis]